MLLDFVFVHEGMFLEEEMWCYMDYFSSLKIAMPGEKIGFNVVKKDNVVKFI